MRLLKGTGRTVGMRGHERGHVPPVGGEADGGERTETFTHEPTYDFQMEAFLTHLRAGTRPPTCGADSIAQMAAIDAIHEKAGRPAARK